LKEKSAQTISFQDAEQLKEDLVHAFNAMDFQVKLLTLRETQYLDQSTFQAAMRSTAMSAQQTVLRKYNLPESAQGVAEMAKVLTFHLVQAENMKPSEAYREAQAMCAGMAKGCFQSWEWPVFLPTAAKIAPSRKSVAEELQDKAACVKGDASAAPTIDSLPTVVPGSDDEVESLPTVAGSDDDED
jgi:hypothetical protein